MSSPLVQKEITFYNDTKIPLGGVSCIINANAAEHLVEGSH